jgi:hypothetical protein
MRLPQGTPRMFGDLYYANKVPTYVGQPLQELDELGANLEDKYYRNVENMDRFSALVNSMDVRDVNNPYLSKKLDEVRSTFSQFHEKGNYEDADGTIRKISRDFAADKTIQGIRKDKALYDQWLKDLDDQAEKGTISRSQRDAAVLMSRYANQDPTTYDPEKMSYSGLYSGVTPPKYVDINARIMDIVKELRNDPNKFYTDLQKSGIPFKYKQDEIAQVTPEQLKEAARDYIKSQDDVREFIGFQTKAADFNSRAYRDEQGKIQLRPFQVNDLVSAGITDETGKINKAVTDANGNPLYQDGKGKQYVPADLIQDPRTGELFVNKGKGMKGEKVTQLFAPDLNTMSLLYDETGNINQDVANQLWSNAYRDAVVGSHTEYAGDYAYRQVKPNYVDDTYGKEVALEGYKSQLAWQNKMRERQLEAADAYVNDFGNWSRGQYEKTISPESLRTLFGAKPSADNAIFKPKPGGKYANLDPNYVNKLPIIADIKKIREGLPYLKGQMERLVDPDGKVAPENQSKYNDLKGRYDFQNNLVNMRMQNAGISEADINNPAFKDLTTNQKNALSVMGILIKNTGQALSYNPANKDNVQRINNNVYGNLTFNFTEPQLKNMLKSSGVDIDFDTFVKTLNEIYDASIVDTGSFAPGEEGKKTVKVWQMNALTPVPISYGAHALYSKAHGNKYDKYTQGMFEETFNEQSGSLRAQAIIEQAGKKNDPTYNALAQAENEGISIKDLNTYVKAHGGKDIGSILALSDQIVNPTQVLGLYSAQLLK